MVSSVTSSVPYSYYNVLNPPVAAAPVVKPVANTGTKEPATSATTGGVKLAPNVLSLLQQLLASDEGPTSTIASLLGAKSDSGTVNSLLNKPQGELRAGNYASLLTAAYNGASAKASQQAVANSYMQNVLKDYQTAMYNLS